MRIKGPARPLACVLRGIASRCSARGLNRIIMAVFPPQHQTGSVERMHLSGATYDARLDSYIDWMAFFHGTYERELLEFLARDLAGRSSPVLLDVGANVGHHSVFFAAQGAIVHAFEPMPGLLQRVRARCEMNPHLPIIVHPLGLADASGILEFFPSGRTNEGQGSFKTDQAGVGAAAMKLRVCEGDGYLEDKGIERVDLVKIDVEGFEPNVLRGLRKTLVGQRPIVVCEIGPLNRTEFSTLDAFAGYLPPDYDFYHLARSGRVLFQWRIEPMTKDHFATFAGNLICHPRASNGGAVGHARHRK